MKIKIDKNGWLKIYRLNRWKDQFCCYHQDCFCGDWCPLFGDPEFFEGELPDGSKFDSVSLDICKKHFCMNKKDFTDERE